MKLDAVLVHLDHCLRISGQGQRERFSELRAERADPLEAAAELLVQRLPGNRRDLLELVEPVSEPDVDVDRQGYGLNWVTTV
jgi:hypothetical protein